MNKFKQYTDSPEDLQQMVDVVVRGLRSQGFEQSRLGDSACRVRGDEGRKCAAGWLLPDELYSPPMENICMVYDAVLIMKGLEIEEGTFMPRNQNLLAALQNAHDGILFSERSLAADVEARLRAVVKRFGLVWPK